MFALQIYDQEVWSLSTAFACRFMNFTLPLFDFTSKVKQELIFPPSPDLNDAETETKLKGLGFCETYL